jgi:hypothetical protein
MREKFIGSTNISRTTEVSPSPSSSSGLSSSSSSSSFSNEKQIRETVSLKLSLPDSQHHFVSYLFNFIICLVFGSWFTVNQVVPFSVEIKNLKNR